MNTNKLPYPIKKYWVNVGTSFLITIPVNFILGLVLGPDIAGVVYIGLVAYWILIEIRRFHDASKTGWFALINIIPGIGTFAALIIAGVLKSEYDNNKWMKGKIPSEEDAEA